MAQPIIFGSVLAYTGLLFAIAYWADRRRQADPSARRNTLVYGLSIAVYCTSWTYYGAVGTAEARGWEYLPIYLGPAIVFSVGYPLLSRMVEIGKRIHTTSIADFLSAHYQKSQALAALVAFIAVVGAIPYIALQLKSVATTYQYIATQSTSSGEAGGVFLVAVILAAFAITFGTRHIDVTRHNRGMIAAIAFDSVIKLVALLAVSLYAYLLMRSGGDSLLPNAASPFETTIDIDRFVTLTVLSMAAILCLPRQFHVTVVECQDVKALRPASALFLIYLLLISFLVVPIANAGRAAISPAGVPPDLMVLALPLAGGADWLALLVFVGGFAAATGMVIVASVALSTMITNDLIAPFLLRKAPRQALSLSFGLRLLYVRRASIAAIIIASAVFAAFAPQGQQLASFGILSFAAAAQFMPALLGALYWRRAHLSGAVAGMGAGFALWLLCLIVPSYFSGAASAVSALTAWLDFTGWDPLTRGVVVSLGANCLIFVALSLSAASAPTTASDTPGGGTTAYPAVRAGDLYLLIQRCLGAKQGKAVIRQYEQACGRRYDEHRLADPALMTFADQQISRAVGASSASILLKSVLAGGSLEIDDVATLLSETTGKVSFSQELLQTTLENISHGVSVVDQDLNLVAWNTTYTEIYRYPPELVREGRPVKELIRFNAAHGECGPGDVADQVQRRLDHLRAGEPHSFERTRPDGSVIRIEGRRSPSGAYVTTFTDVSDYKKIQKALSESERSIRFYTDNIPSMVAFADGDEKIRFANEAYRSMFDVSEDDVIGASLSDIMPEQDYADRKPHIERALRGERATFDIEIAAAGGVQHMQVAYVPQFREDGSVRGFFGLYQDVTARRRAEQALAETNESLEQRVADRTRELSALNAALDSARRDAELATASKTRFLAAASHDVLQPLNAARLFASALAEERADEREASDLVQKIDASIASADRLLRSLLNISKLDAGGVKPELSEFPVTALFEELANEFSYAAKAKGIEFRICKTAMWIRSDRGLLFSALQNIVSNAVRYTDSGRILIGARHKGGSVRIEIHDTGRGIPASKLAEIFQEFKRLDHDGEGVGLGLATVDRVSQLLSLNVSVRSEEQKGSMFALTAPRAATRARPDIRVAPMRGSLQSLSVICIDNDEAVLEAMQTALSRWGADVAAFKSGEAALASLSKEAPPPDLLLLDFQLDHGRTGFEALEALERVWGERPVTIMITASVSGDVEMLAKALDIPVLQKPIEPAELRTLINQLHRQAAE